MTQRIWITTAVAGLTLSATACKPGPNAAPPPSASAPVAHPSGAPLGPLSSPVAPTLDEGWCGGHGVPESVCTRCNGSLTAAFKAAGDWCAAHDLPESQCFVCHPDLEALWARLNAPDQPADGATPPLGPLSSPVAPTLDEGWCGGHGVPESVCTRCNGSLTAAFKAAGDWCAAHDLPDSQCFVCHPDLEAVWARPNAPDQPADTSAAGSAVRVDRASRLLTGGNDSLCRVEEARVRLADATLLDKAGIELQAARRQVMSAAIDLPAEVEFDATRVIRVTPRLAGIVLEVPVRVGETVVAGQVLAVIDSPVLGEAKSQTIERSQNLRLAEADRVRQEIIQEGVQRMLAVCTPDAQPEAVREALAQSRVGDAKARLLRAHAALQLARSEAARATTLLERQLNSERDVQAAHSALAAAEADFVALREEVAFDIERSALVAEREAEVARSALESSTRRLQILGLDAAEIARIGSAGDPGLSRYVVRSAAGGRVIERSATVGEAVEPNDPLFVVADLSTMWLMADLTERDLIRVRPGQAVFFTADGMPGLGFDGTVTWVSSQVDDRTRTVPVRAELPNPDGLLRARMFGRARIVLHDNDDVLTVPDTAVQSDGCCQLVFVRESATVFRPRKVLLGAGGHGAVEVLSGLQEGEVVVSAGSFLMKTEILKGNIGAGCCEVDPGR